MSSQLSQVDFGHDKFVMRVALVHNTPYYTAVTNLCWTYGSCEAPSV